MSTTSSTGPPAACNSCGQPLHPHPSCCPRSQLDMVPAAPHHSDADESSAADSSSEDEPSASEEEGEKSDESVEKIDADSSGGSRDRLQQEEGAGSPDPWDNGPVTPPLAADPTTSTGRPRRTPSARLVDDSGGPWQRPHTLRASSRGDDWSAALAATAGPGPRSTPGLCQAPQDARLSSIRDVLYFPPTLIMAFAFFNLINLSICL